MLQQPELLAPAGSLETLKYAVMYGADAVYCALPEFGMRAAPVNLTVGELHEGCIFAHARGKKVYLTLNTLPTNEELSKLPRYIQDAAEAGVDAFIIADLGVLALAKKYAPQVERHVSTQAGITNYEAAKVCYELGAKRVVLARELPLTEIAQIRDNCPQDLELEAFVHGAMCMAVSGRCLISAALTGRSGNKGHCTQPCRWSYALVEEQRPGEFFPVEEDVRGTYVMNAQDLNMLAHLDDLAAAGIDSFKIEGRNKKAFYVASVVRAYRLALDGVPSSELADELLAVSHRPYGTGFYYGDARQSPDVDGYTAECRHAATVEACEPAGEGAFRVIARCYNRFCEGDELEALSPGPHVPLVRVRNLAWLPAPDGDDAQPKRVPVAVANRSAERYAFETGEELAPGDFLRMRINVER